MKTCIANLSSVSRYSQSRYIDPSLRGEKESPAAFERRIWREKSHYDEDENVFIPPIAFKQSLDEAARYLSIQVPGRGKTTYTKHFKSGVLCFKPVMLGLKKSETKPNEIYAHSDGKRGSGSRVKRTFPTVDKWSSDVEFVILDDIITEDVFLRVLKEAGSLIGIGQFRPQNGGYFGRWIVNSHEWNEVGV